MAHLRGGNLRVGFRPGVDMYQLPELYLAEEVLQLTQWLDQSFATRTNRTQHQHMDGLEQRSIAE
jgi:hypothetical protein